MKHLTRHDYADALQVLARMEALAGDVNSFERAAVLVLSDYVCCDLTTLSICNLSAGQRQAVDLPGVRPGLDEIDCLDRHYFEYSLVQHYGTEGGCQTCRMSDLVSRHDFERSALYADYHRRIGFEYAIAVPLQQDQRTLVSVVLNRSGPDFNERERERLELLRPHLAFLYRHAQNSASSPAADASLQPLPQTPEVRRPDLTRREREVMQWLACGKTDAEIAALLAISPRTVQKHLEHMYVKLGVETRTAAVMRALDINSQQLWRKAPAPALQPSN